MKYNPIPEWNHVDIRTCKKGMMSCLSSGVGGNFYGLDKTTASQTSDVSCNYRVCLWARIVYIKSNYQLRILVKSDNFNGFALLRWEWYIEFELLAGYIGKPHTNSSLPKYINQWPCVLWCSWTMQRRSYGVYMRYDNNCYYKLLTVINLATWLAFVRSKIFIIYILWALKDGDTEWGNYTTLWVIRVRCTIHNVQCTSIMMCYCYMYYFFLFLNVDNATQT